MENPNIDKFKSINLSNKGFKKRVGDIIGGRKILQEIGFEDRNGAFVLQN